MLQLLLRKLGLLKSVKDFHKVSSVCFQTIGLKSNNISGNYFEFHYQQPLDSWNWDGSRLCQKENDDPGRFSFEYNFP